MSYYTIQQCVTYAKKPTNSQSIISQVAKIKKKKNENEKVYSVRNWTKQSQSVTSVM